jgi:hypothetical protein
MRKVMGGNWPFVEALCLAMEKKKHFLVHPLYLMRKKPESFLIYDVM